jgi:hypothetical protein
MRRAILAAVSALGLVALGAPGCNAVLGIDEAKLETATGDGGADADGGTNASGCVDYCNQMASNCQNNRAEWVDIDTCLAFCGTWDIGTPNDQTGNTVNCHLNHAKAAANAVDECPKAGPSGGGVCGEPCQNFCNLDSVFCGMETGAKQPYPNHDCLMACRTFPLVPGNIANTTSGNSLQCRYYHLEAAVQGKTQTFLDQHCPHTAPISMTCN